jgi:hypothetical protein
VYNALRLFININRIGFLYNIGVKHILSSLNNALLTFFFDKVKRLIKVITYKLNSVILHLKVNPLFQLLFLYEYIQALIVLVYYNFI